MTRRPQICGSISIYLTTMKIRNLIIPAIAFAAFSANASEVELTYNKFGLQPHAYDMAASDETIDVAVRLDGTLCGKNVTGIRVPILGDPEAFSNPEAFLTSKLNTKTQNGHKYNLPDICTVSASISDGTLTATFAELYEIPAGGVIHRIFHHHRREHKCCCRGGDA